MWGLSIITIIIALCAACVYFIALSHDDPYKSVVSRINNIEVLLAMFLGYFFLIVISLNRPENIGMITIYIACLVVCAAILDTWFMVIPDRLLAIFIPSIVFIQLFNGVIINGLFGAAFGFIFLLVIAVISKGGIGGGDIKLVTVIGLGTSLDFIYQLLLISCILTFLIGIIALYSGARKRNEMMPFGPAIAFATIFLLTV
ncbi:prepilin peptidase [Virgibacillus doumboii]|uniref:prepilin peptidase n=1 Tax=Virgibacillus doumboii TaxID=2697503 RepID=UPI0013DFB980|nr:prepilin peptidase [Virgibacillus doumboii]